MTEAHSLPGKRFRVLHLLAGLVTALLPAVIATWYAWDTGARWSSLDHVRYSAVKSALTAGLVVYVYPPILMAVLLTVGLILVRRTRTRSFGLGLALSPVMIFALIALVHFTLR